MPVIPVAIFVFLHNPSNFSNIIVGLIKIFSKLLFFIVACNSITIFK